MHSTEFNDDSIIKDKRVVVVGGGKSASDVVVIAAEKARECYLIFRQTLWKFPRFFLGFINLKYILLTRFSEAWFPYHKMGKYEKLLHTIGKPIVWFFWRMNEIILRLQLDLDSCNMLPEKPIDQMDCSASIAPVNFFEYIKSGKIQAIKGNIAKFIPGGIQLVNGQQLQVDVVIFGTGFSKEVNFLEEKYLCHLFDQDGNFRLYRYLINPEIPQMGFVGYLDNFFNLLVSEIGAWWLVDYVKGNLSLPSSLEMHQDIAVELDWLKNHLYLDKTKGICIGSFSLRYTEELLADMAGSRQIKLWKTISQIMQPVNTSSYHEWRQELKRQKLSEVNPPI